MPLVRVYFTFLGDKCVYARLPLLANETKDVER